MEKYVTKVTKPSGVKRNLQPEPGSPDSERNLAFLATSGAACGASVVEVFQKNLMGEEVKFLPVFEGLTERLESIKSGDLGMVESMLFCQAAGLQAMFASLTRRATAQDMMSHYQTFMGLALKAQAQSRATLEALVELKRPRQQPTFVKQANIANGPQQVNNGVDTISPSRTAPIADAGAHAGAHAAIQNSGQTKLLETSDGQRLDTRAQGAAGGDDSHLASVGAVHRSSNG